MMSPDTKPLAARWATTTVTAKRPTPTPTSPARRSDESIDSVVTVVYSPDLDHATSRTTLISLPTEIRLLIINHVLRASNPAPADPTAATDIDSGYHKYKHSQQAKARREANDINYVSWSRADAVMYDGQSRDIIWNVEGLLRTNKQLHEETLSVLRSEKESLLWEVDLMVVGKGEIWPTWTRLPVESHVMDRVDVTVRSFGRPEGRGMMRERRMGMLPTISWLMFSFLERLVRVGICGIADVGVRLDDDDDDNDDDEIGNVSVNPHAAVGTMKRPRGVVIRELVIDFVSSDSPDQRTTAAAQSAVEEKSFTDLVREMAIRPLGDKQGNEAPALEPDVLLTLFKTQMHEMFHVAMLPLFYRALFFERIGIVRFCRDGSPDTTWDLAEMLASKTHETQRLPLNLFLPWGDEPMLAWKKWRDEVYDRRHTAGLS